MMIKSKAAKVPNKPTKASSEQKHKAVDNELRGLVEGLNKKFGVNAITIGVPNEEGYVVERVPTGSLALDVALGGGLPLGRYTQIAGAFSSTKTTQTALIIANAQKMGLVCAFFDVEGTSDEQYFRKCGVDYDNLIYSRPDGSEEAFEMMLQLQKSGKVNFGVIDSLAALSPNKEQDTAMDETMRMGITQQLLGEFFRKYQANNNRLSREGNKPFTIVCINQLREKIGCFNYTARVLLEDGSTEMIGKIVNKQLPVKVITLNEETQKFESAPVTGFFNNGRAEEFLRLTFDKPYGNGTSSFRCTPNHNILTPHGYVKAHNLKVGDEVVQHITYKDLSDIQKSIMIGSMLGDGSIRKEKRSSYSFRLSHCKEQKEYSDWKTKFFQGSIYTRSDGAVLFSSEASQAFLPYYEDYYEFGRKCVVPNNVVLDPISIAVWFQDDGYLVGNSNEPKAVEFSTHRFDIDSVKTLSNCLLKRCINNSIREVSPNQFVISCTVEGTANLIREIGKYIHPTMQYKVPEYLRPLCSSAIDTVTPEFLTCSHHVRKATLLSIGIADMTNLSMTKYDLEVKGNHNFVVDGIVVHNSYGDPDYAPGGKAKDFAMSVDLRLRRGDWITEGSGDSKEIVGQVVKFKVEKNKTYRRMMTGEFDFYFTDDNSANVAELHNDNFKEIVVLAVEFGIIEHKGAWFMYEDSKYQGLNNLIDALKKDDKMVNAIRKEVLELAVRKND